MKHRTAPDSIYLPGLLILYLEKLIKWFPESFPASILWKLNVQVTPLIIIIIIPIYPGAHIPSIHVHNNRVWVEGEPNNLLFYNRNSSTLPHLLRQSRLLSPTHYSPPPSSNRPCDSLGELPSLPSGATTTFTSSTFYFHASTASVVSVLYIRKFAGGCAWSSSRPSYYIRLRVTHPINITWHTTLLRT